MPDPIVHFGRKPSPLPADFVAPLRGPDWQQADPGRIAEALARALARPTGGWYVVDSVRAIGQAPQRYRIADREWVVWRTRAGFRVAPDACPHMGASLACGRVEKDHLVCPWHGLRLTERGHGAWQPRPAHDDGVLLWARLDDSGPLSDAPILPVRPKQFLDAVVRMEASCEPRDVLANRLDPWHGSHYHPHSFARLSVLAVDSDVLTVRVAVRLWGPVVIEVDATFHCPEPRTIVMTIIGGEGQGSVVETHATPISPGRTAIIEATLATSERRGFDWARRMGPLIRPAMRWAAHRLWVEDAAYAERTYALRQDGWSSQLRQSERAHRR